MTSWTSLPTEEAFITLRALGRVALTNFWIKVFFNSRNCDFGSSFLQKVVSLNIPGFSQFRAHLEDAMGMTPTSGYHFKPTVRNDIITLSNHHDMDNIFTFHPGRTQPFQVKDIFGIGIEKLGQTSLIKDFLACTSEASPDSELTGMGEEDGVDVEMGDGLEGLSGLGEGGALDVEMDEFDDEGLDDFEGPNDLLR